MAGGAAGSEGTHDVAMPDRLIRTVQLVELAQRSTELSGDDMLPVAGGVARVLPGSPSKSGRHDVRPAPAGVEQVPVGDVPRHCNAQAG